MPWRVRTPGNCSFPGRDLVFTVGGGRGIRLWSQDSHVGLKLELLLSAEDHCDFLMATALVSEDTHTCVVILVDSGQSGLIYSLPVEYRLEEGAESFLSSAADLQPISSHPHRRAITSMSSVGNRVIYSDDLSRIYEMKVDLTRRHQRCKSQLIFVGVDLRVPSALSIQLLGNNHLVQPAPASGGVRYVNLEEGRVVATFHQQNTADVGTLTAICASPDAKHIALGYSTGTLELFSLSTTALVSTIRVSDAYGITSISFADHGRIICSAMNGKVFILKLRPDKHFRNMMHISSVLAMSCEATPSTAILVGETLMMGSEDEGAIHFKQARSYTTP